MQANTFKRSAIALAIVGAFGFGAYSAERLTMVSPARAASSAVPVVATATPGTPMVALPNFADMAATVGPAVVNISVVGNMRTAARMPEMDIPDEMKPFFRHFQMPQQDMPTRGAGSGFIVSPDGVILTNAHVVDGADEVTVKLTDKREFTAKVLGTDKTTDVAVLKIDATALPYVTIGDPNARASANGCVAIGQPFGFENTVTSGSSARNRGRCPATARCRSSRRTSPSTRATREARCSISRAR